MAAFPIDLVQNTDSWPLLPLPLRLPLLRHNLVNSDRDCSASTDQPAALGSEPDILHPKLPHGSAADSAR
ncbi:hypothetical protein PG989_012873 [Apiospora arundinis]